MMPGTTVRPFRLMVRVQALRRWPPRGPTAVKRPSWMVTSRTRAPAGVHRHDVAVGQAEVAGPGARVRGGLAGQRGGEEGRAERGEPERPPGMPQSVCSWGQIVSGWACKLPAMKATAAVAPRDPGGSRRPVRASRPPARPPLPDMQAVAAALGVTCDYCHAAARHGAEAHGQRQAAPRGGARDDRHDGVAERHGAGRGGQDRARGGRRHLRHLPSRRRDSAAAHRDPAVDQRARGRRRRRQAVSRAAHPALRPRRLRLRRGDAADRGAPPRQTRGPRWRSRSPS